MEFETVAAMPADKSYNAGIRKVELRKRPLLPAKAWCAGCLVLASSVAAPAFAGSPLPAVQELFSFNRSSTTEGNFPFNGLVQGSDGNFYGTTENGGANGYGTVFQITPLGTLTTLYSFANSGDGEFPLAGLVQGRDGSFYGLTSENDYAFPNVAGTVFKITASGAFTTLYTFGIGIGGSSPSTLVEGNDGNFYGTTEQGSTYYGGSVFRITPSGSFTTLYSFTGGNDGAAPIAGLVLGSDGNFYGTTAGGGAGGGGTIFSITATGALTTLYSFSELVAPYTPLAQATDGIYYGTTDLGGTYGYGTIFTITSSGKYAIVHSFTNGSDGANPRGALEPGSDGNFYGTTSYGGTGPQGGLTSGVLYAITPGGTLASLFEFGTGSAAGANPLGGLVQGRDGSFYGTNSGGGSYSAGTVFDLRFSPALPSPDVTQQISSSIVSQSFSPLPAPGGEGPAGVRTLNVEFCNDGAVALAGLYIQLTALSDGDSLVNRTVGSTVSGEPGGVGAELTLPPYTASSPALPAGACITAPFEFGLSANLPVSVKWRVYGHQ